MSEKLMYGVQYSDGQVSWYQTWTRERAFEHAKAHLGKVFAVEIDDVFEVHGFPTAPGSVVCGEDDGLLWARALNGSWVSLSEAEPFGFRDSTDPGWTLLFDAGAES